MATIVLNEREYTVSDLDQSCQLLVHKINEVNVRLKEAENMRAVLTKAKRAYIAELKSEMLSAKAGFDFNE